MHAGFYHKLRNFLEAATSKRVHYIAVSNAIKSQLTKIGISEQKITVIHPAYNISQKSLVRRTNRDCFVFGAAGRLEKVKGFDILIRAFSKIAELCSNVQLHIYGEGTQRSSLQRLASHFRLVNRVLLPGYKPTELLYQDMDVFVSSSLTEGFSITLLEAAHLGIPCICTSAGGQVEIIEHQKTGIVVPPGNANTLADAMLFAYQNYDIMLKLAAEAKSFTDDRFSPEKLVNRHDELFKKIIQSYQQKTGPATAGPVPFLNRLSLCTTQ